MISQSNDKLSILYFYNLKGQIELEYNVVEGSTKVNLNRYVYGSDNRLLRKEAGIILNWKGDSDTTNFRVLAISSVFYNSIGFQTHEIMNDRTGKRIMEVKYLQNPEIKRCLFYDRNGAVTDSMVWEYEASHALKELKTFKKVDNQYRLATHEQIKNEFDANGVLQSRRIKYIKPVRETLMQEHFYNYSTNGLLAVRVQNSIYRTKNIKRQLNVKYTFW